MIDCVLANWDVGYNANVGFVNNSPIRTDVGGALAYRAKGEFKLSFFNNYHTNEHTNLLSSSFIQACIKEAGSFDLYENLTPQKINQLNTMTISDKIDKRYHPYMEQIRNKVIERAWYYLNNQPQILNQMQLSGKPHKAKTQIKIK